MASNVTLVPYATRDGAVKTAILFVILIIFLYLNATVGQRNFSDTDTYLFYIDSIYFFPESGWWNFEALSKALMVGLREMAQDTEYSIYLYRYLLILIFPFSIYYIYRYSSWQALLVSLALYGPLLGLITMRATPAYIFATLAAVSALEGKKRSVGYLLAGFLFHVSTALAVPAVLAALALKKYGVVTIRTSYIFASFILLFVFYGVIANAGVEFFINLFKSFSYLAKYTAYVPGTEDTRAIQAEAPKLAHYIFAVAVVGLSLFLILKARADQGVEKLFIAFSLVLYLALFGLSSPVVSVRYSPFFILPALSWIDISIRSGFRSVTATMVVIGSVIVFGLSLQQVIYAQ
jgi:hypothetical protein